MRALLGIGVLCATTRAWADRPVRVELDDHTPFSSADLTTALRVRIDPSGAAVRVVVHTTGDDVVVEAQGRSRPIALGGRIGIDAARLVALAAADLLFDDLAIAPDAVTASALPGRRHPDALTISAVGGAALWSTVMAGASVDLALPFGRWIAVVDVGAAELLDRQLSLTSASVRLGGGVRTGSFELRTGLTLAPISVSDGRGDTTVLVGAGASIRLRVPITNNARLVVAAGADAFATRTEYHVDPMTVIATPWFAPWIAVGVEVTP